MIGKDLEGYKKARENKTSKVMDEVSVGGASVAGHSVCSSSTAGTKVEIEYVEGAGSTYGGGSVHKITAIGRKGSSHYSVPRKHDPIAAAERMRKMKVEAMTPPRPTSNAYRLPPAAYKQKANLESSGKRRADHTKRRKEHEKENNAISTALVRLTEDRDVFTTKSGMSTVNLSSKGSTTSLNYAAAFSPQKSGKIENKLLPLPATKRPHQQKEVIEFVLPKQFRQTHLDTIEPSKFQYTSNLQNLDAIWISTRQNNEGKVDDEENDSDSKSSRPFDCYSSVGSAEDLSTITGSHATLSSDQATVISSNSKEASPGRQAVSIAYQAASIHSSDHPTRDTTEYATPPSPSHFEVELEESYECASSGPLSSNRATESMSPGHASSVASRNHMTIESSPSSVASRAYAASAASQAHSEESDHDGASALPFLLEKFRSFGASIYDERDFNAHNDQRSIVSNSQDERKMKSVDECIQEEVAKEAKRDSNSSCAKGGKGSSLYSLDEEPFDCYQSVAAMSTSTHSTSAPDPPELRSYSSAMTNPGAVWIPGLLGAPQTHPDEDESIIPDYMDIENPLDCLSGTERTDSDRVLVLAELAPNHDEEIEEAVRQRISAVARASAVVVEESVGDNSFDEYHEMKRKWVLVGLFVIFGLGLLALAFGLMMFPRGI